MRCSLTISVEVGVIPQLHQRLELRDCTCENCLQPFLSVTLTNSDTNCDSPRATYFIISSLNRNSRIACIIIITIVTTPLKSRRLEKRHFHERIQLAEGNMCECYAFASIPLILYCRGSGGPVQSWLPRYIWIKYGVISAFTRCQSKANCEFYKRSSVDFISYI